MSVKELLFDLCEAPGPSGAESGVMVKASALAKSLGAEVTFDNLGSMTAFFRCGKENAKLIMLDAHLDEVSLVITGDAGGGFFRFKTIGHDPRVLPGSGVCILSQKGNIPGVITSVPPHVQRADEADKAYKTADLFIDTGLLENDCGISIGSRALLEGRRLELSEDYVSAPSLDNRAGFACLIEVMKLLIKNDLPCDIALVGSVLEEFGGMGALTSANRLRPDMAVIVDVTHAKTPDSPGDESFKAGSGPAVGMGPNLDRKLAKTLQTIAKRREIPHSLEVMAGNTGTNAWPVQISGRGVPCALVSIPLKYMHTPQEVINIKDLESSANLIAAFISEWAGGAK